MIFLVLCNRLLDKNTRLIITENPVKFRMSFNELQTKILDRICCGCVVQTMTADWVKPRLALIELARQMTSQRSIEFGGVITCLNVKTPRLRTTFLGFDINTE